MPRRGTKQTPPGGTVAPGGYGDAGNVPVVAVDQFGRVTGISTVAVSGGVAVKEIDGAPNVSGVSTIRVSNGTLTDDGSGQVTINTGGGGASQLDDLSDVVIGSPANDQVLKYNGSNWVNAAAPGGAGVTGSGTSGNYPKFTGASAIGDGNLTEGGSPVLVQTNTANFRVNKAATGVAFTFSNNVGAPSSFDNWQIALYTSGGGAGSSYGLGVESNFLWLNSDGGFKFYFQGTAKWQFNNSSFALEPIADNQVEIGSSTKGIKTVYLPGGIKIVSGSGSPEGVVTAPVGSTYHRSDGGAGTSYYVKESGSGNTGWVAK